MAGRVQWEAQVDSNIKQILGEAKQLRDELDGIKKGNYEIKLNIDEKKLENVISNLDKMLTSLGKGTGDFKEFENLSKQLKEIVSEVQTLNKAFGNINDSGTSELLSSIKNIDKSLSSLSEHIVGVNKDFSGIGKNASDNVGHINDTKKATEGLVETTRELANAQKNVGNKSSISSDNINDTVNQLLKVDEIISKVSEHAKSLTGRNNGIFNNSLNGIKDILSNQDILKLFSQYSSQTMNMDSLKEMVDILNECRENMLSTEEISKRFSSIISSQFTATIPETEKLNTSIFEICKAIKEFSQVKGISDQTTGKDLFVWISENATEAQKEIFKVSEGYEKFQSVLRGLSINAPQGAMNYSSTLGLDTFNFDISTINSFLNKENELVNASNIAENELKELRTAIMNTFSISPNGDGSLTVTLKQLQEIVEQCPKAKQYIDEINSSISDKSNISSTINDTFQGGATSAEKLEEEIKNIDSATKKASESAKEYRKILSQVGEFDIDSKVSAMYKRNDGQLESWTWRAKRDDDGNVLYDQNGKIDYGNPTITVISKYEQLEKIIVKADNELRNLQKDLSEIKAYDPTASTTNIEAKISDQKEYIRLLEQTVKVISQSDEYLLDEQQIIEARNKAAREYALTTGAKQEKTDAKQSASDEKKRLANIEQVNRALNKQQITIDAIEKTYNKTTNPDLDREVSNQQDLAELSQKKLDIQTKINSLQGQERNSANEKEFLELERLIAEYKELAKYKLKANNPSKQELGGQNLQTLIQVQISNYDKLITKAEKYGDATTDTVEKLKEQRDILSKIGADGKYTATADQYYASRDTYKVESAALSAFEAETKAAEQEAKVVQKLAEEKRKLRQQEKQSTQSSVDKALTDQVSAWKQIQSIREKIAKTDSADEINALQESKKYYQEQYNNANKILKANDDLYDKESQIARLEQIRLETNAKIAGYKKDISLSSMKSELKTFNNQIPKKPVDGQRSDYFEGFVQNYKNAISQAQKYLDDLGDSPVTEEVKKKWEELTDAIKKAKKEMDDVPNADRGSDALSRGKEIDTITKYLSKFTGISKQAKQELKGLIDQLQSGDPSVNVKKIHERFLELTASERAAGREAKSFLDIFKSKVLHRFASQLAMYYLSFYDFIRYARNAITAVKELDTALIDLKKTTTMSSSELEQFYYDSNDVAKKMGVTTQSIIEQASAWSRLGYSTKEASTQMAELSSQFASISPGMSTDDAQEGLVSIMKAWDISTDQVEREVMDNINILGKIIAQTHSNVWCYLVIV